MNEEKCEYVSIFGIAKSCNVFPKVLTYGNKYFDQTDYKNIKDNDTVFIFTYQLNDFCEIILPSLIENKIKIILVTGGDDYGVPNTIDKIHDTNFLNKLGPVLLKWCCTNYDNDELLEEFLPIPMGMNYSFENLNSLDIEQEIQNIDSAAEDLGDRIPKCISTYHWRLFENDKTQDKWLAMEALNDKKFHRLTQCRLPGDKYFKLMSEYKFVVCPQSSAYDTYRIYEALAVGSIPIVKKNTLEGLYSLFPILVVDNWEDLTDMSWKVFSDFDRYREYHRIPLYLKYWVDAINENKREMEIDP